MWLTFGLSALYVVCVCVCVFLTMFDCLFHSEKTPKQVTPVQQPYAEIHLGQESQKTLSLCKKSINTYTQQNVADCDNEHELNTEKQEYSMWP